MLHLWSDALDHGDSVHIFFTNYTKALDHTDHTLAK